MRQRNHEKNQTNSDAENATNKMKNAIESFNKLNQAKEFVNLKTVLLILSSQREKNLELKSVKKIYINYEAPSNKTIYAYENLRRIREKRQKT